MSDRIVVRWRAKRSGVWYPEDRLRAAVYGALFFVPLSVLISGLLLRYVDGRLGFVLNLVCLFFNGIGVRASSDRDKQAKLRIRDKHLISIWIG